jgi:hypothetical protein
MTKTFPSLFGGWRAALLLATVAVSASPGRATAACGDHVTILNAGVKDGVSATPDGGIPVPPRAPCQGPNCSGAPERHAPLPAPAPSSGPQVKDVAHPGEYSEHPAESARLFAGERTLPHPIDVASSIFHPPRRG